MITLAELMKRMEEALNGKEIQVLRPGMSARKSFLYPVEKLLRNEKHSGGSTFSYHGKLTDDEVAEVLKRVGGVHLTPYHLEDSFNTHMKMVFSHWLEKFSQSVFVGRGELLAQEFDSTNVTHLAFVSGMLASRLHDIGKPYRRELKISKNKDLAYYSYSGHHISGFNIARMLIPQLMDVMFDGELTNKDSEWVRVVYFATTILILLHQHNDISKLEEELSKFFRTQYRKNNSIHGIIGQVVYMNYENLLHADRMGSLSVSPYKEPITHVISSLMSKTFSINSSIHKSTVYASTYEDIADALKVEASKAFGNQKPLFISFIGASNSGKNHFIEWLKSSKVLGDTEIHSVSLDDIRIKMYAEKHGISEEDVNYVLAHEYSMHTTEGLNEMNNRYQRELYSFWKKGPGRVIILNNTHTSLKSYRRGLAGLNVPANMVTVFFDVDPIVLARRELTRRIGSTKKVPLHVIKKQVIEMNPLVLPTQKGGGSRFTFVWFTGGREFSWIEGDKPWVAEDEQAW